MGFCGFACNFWHAGEYGICMIEVQHMRRATKDDRVV